MFVFFDAKPAPGAPGRASTWTTGAKDGIGTAYYDPTTGPSRSNVWYTLTNGVLTEVYYPDVARANMNMLQFVVTDANTFVDTELDATDHTTRCVATHALTYEQVNVAKSGRYRIQKTYVVDPQAHAMVIQVTLTALIGRLRDYRVFVYVNPLINNKGVGNSAQVVKTSEGLRLTAHDAQTAFAIGASLPLRHASVGYVGVSDGLTQLLNHHALRETYDVADNGNVALTAELSCQSPSDTEVTFEVVIGFGGTQQEAVSTVNATLAKPFSAVRASYEQDWESYLRTLRQPEVGPTHQYYISAMVLRAHEDKLHPGAIIASLTVPWGDRVLADHGGVGGYHLVWSRDFYQVASALALIGDTETARRALDYLDGTQQRPDGSFPQNSWLDGTPYWQGIQLDEVALPILLAHLLQDQGRYQSLVRPAANYLVRTGPYTPQERWEENAGFSPSTMAAEIAGLVAAAEFARSAQDFAAAAVYFRYADEWARRVDDWTITHVGTLAPHPYYIRISDTQTPDDGHEIEIRNGGGWHAKADVVDAGFLELVRLGIKAPDDPRVVESLNVVDGVICHETAYGPVWYRYNYDGYGEHPDGSPYDGTGRGRPWPLLVGERGEYEVALRALTSTNHAPQYRFDPRDLLQTMANSANQGGLIPEQIWDDESKSDRALQPGRGTGSATPLAWAMAQYLRLSECIRQGRVVECPVEVLDRYQNRSRCLGPCVLLEFPLHGSVATVTSPFEPIRGTTEAGTTVVLTVPGTSDWTSTTAAADGSFTLNLPHLRAGLNVIDVIGYDNGHAISWQAFAVRYEPRLIFELYQSGGTDHHDPLVSYPTHPDFKPGDFDLRGVRVSTDEEAVFFEVMLGHLDNPWGGPSGISKQLIDIYLDLGLPGPRETSTMGLQARFADDAAWQKLIRVTGNWHGEAHVYNADWTYGGPIDIYANHALATVTIRVLRDALGVIPGPGHGIMVFVAGEDNGGVRPVQGHATDWTFGTPSNQHHSDIVDWTVPPGLSRRHLLEDTFLSVRLPTFRLR